MENEYKPIGGQSTIRPVIKQAYLCLAGSTYFVLTGLSFGSPTVVIPQLRKEANSTAAVSEEMASWTTSIVSFSAMPWTCILILMSHYIGRKKPWLMTAVISFIAFTVFYFSKNIIHVFISQLLSGITLGTQITVSLMVLSECSSPRNRGVFLTLKSASFYWGIWIANTIGTYFDYRYIGLFGIMCSISNFVIIMFIPETPYWLAYKGRYDECAIAHRSLKGVDDDAEKELNELIKSQQEYQISKYNNKYISEFVKSYLTLFRQPEFYKPVLIIMLVKISYQASGKLVYAVYAVEMLKKITKSKSMAYKGMLILDGFSVCGMYVGCVFSKFFKRRTLLLSTSIAGAILSFVISFYLYLVKLEVLSENIYLIMTLLVVFSLTICGGPLILSSCLAGELYPLKSRSFCILVVSIIGNLILGLILKLSPYIFHAFNFHGTFLIFGSAFSICIFLLYLYLPETKDKTLNEIAAYYEKKELHSPDSSDITLLKNKDIELVAPLKSNQVG